MVRLTVVAASLLLAMGCSGLIDGGSNGDLTPEEVEARRLWVEKALPQLQTNCVVCHDGSRANIGFLTGGGDLEKRDTILAYTPTVVNLDAPSSSRALTKGIHEGPALDAIQASDILEWANAEKLAAAPAPGEEGPRLETAQVLPQICTSGLPDAPGAPNPLCPVNKIPLAELGAVGAEIHFVVQALGSGLYMTNLRLVPAADGAFIDHPLFVAYPDGAAAKADTIDRFFNVKMNLMAGATLEEQTIAGGNAAFVGFFPTDKLSIHFKATSVFQPEEGGPVGATGCKVLADFKAAVAQPLQTNCAAQCHAGGQPNAQSAVNMANLLSANDDEVLAACGQIRTRVNFPDIPNSGLFLAPAPGNNNHPFQFQQAAHDAFENAITPWIIAERDAP